jgi:hypothetical protein
MAPTALCTQETLTWRADSTPTFSITETSYIMAEKTGTTPTEPPREAKLEGLSLDT